MDGFRDMVERNIRDHRVAIIATETEIEGASVSMAYTIGLSDVGRPEIITFGLPFKSAHPLLNDAAALLLAEALPSDTRIDALASMPLVFKPVTAGAGANFLIQANARARRELPSLQMVWPDPAGRFPWEPGFEERFRRYQPPLYEQLSRTDFEPRLDSDRRVRDS